MRIFSIRSTQVLFGALFASTLGMAQTPVALTLQQALDTARAHNPSLSAAQQHVTATRASEVTAGLRQNPIFTLSGSDVSLSATNPANPYSYTANGSRLFERGEKRRWRLDAARATSEVTQSQYQDTERQTTLAVKDSFTNMLAAKAALKIADENLSGYRDTVRLSKIRLDVGDISATDFDRIDLQLAEFEDDDDDARLQLVQASDQLQSLLGAAKPIDGFDISGTLDLPTVRQTEVEFEQAALAARPDYQAAVQSVRLADANVKVAVSDGTTDPTIGGEYERTATYNTAGFQLSIPVRIFDRNQGEKQRTRYEAQSSRFAEVAVRNQVVSDVDQAWAAYVTAGAQAKRYNDHYVALSQRVRDNVEYSYRHGGTTLLDYLDALRDYRQVNLDALNANQKVRLALDQLSFAAAVETLP
jgi:cobalt-zinc-cadmium efflux system outer membrane protein